MFLLQTTMTFYIKDFTKRIADEAKPQWMQANNATQEHKLFIIALSTTSESNFKLWYLDSGASQHVTQIDSRNSGVQMENIQTEYIEDWCLF